MSEEEVKKSTETEVKVVEPDHEIFKNLTLRQAAFVRHYVKDYNAKSAAIAVGYKAKGATTTGTRLLKDPSIQEALAKLKAEIQKKAEFTLQDIIDQTENLINEARECKQYSAVSKMIETKAKLTGHLWEKYQVDHNVKASFIVQVPSFKAPKYAIEENKTIDVTPTKQKSDE